MRHLTFHHWSRFIKEDGGFNGRLFEEFAERLLNLHYGGSWRITKVSWDGGKDLVSEEILAGDPSGKRASWTECKIHRKPVSLKLVSNTLVMALVDNAKRLILFSYSPLIENAKIHLARYSVATGIKVEIIDDDLLEELTLRHFHEVRPVFFPEVAPHAFVHRAGDELQLIPRLTRDFDVDPLRLGADDEPNGAPKAERVVNLRSVLRLQLAVRNRRLLDAAAVTVALRGAEPMTSPFELLNDKCAQAFQSIPASGLGLFEFYFRPNTAGTNLPLPTLEISDGARRLSPVTLGSISVRGLLVPPLVGGRFHEFIADFRELISLRSRPVTASVSGSAGVGKSRLTAELATELVARGFEIHKFDGANGDVARFTVFARKLCTRLYRLPDLISTPPRPEAVAGTGLLGLDRILYDANLDLTSHVNEVLELVKRAINSRSVALVIDNVQYLDHVTVGFLENLVRNYRETAARFVGVFVFNTDYLDLNQNALAFRESLREWERNEREQALRCTLGDFSTDETNLLLDHLVSLHAGDFCGGFTARHPRLAALFREKIVPRPLHLLQTMFYLADQHALCRQEDYLYVDDIGTLHETLCGVPSDLADLMQQRWHRVVAARPDLEPVGRLLACLRVVHEEDFGPLGVSLPQAEAMIGLGIATAGPLGDLCFFHEQIERIFARFYRDLDPEKSAAIARRLHEAGLSERYFQSYVIAASRSGTEDDALVRKAAAFLLTGLPQSDLNREFAERLRGLIRKRPEALSAADDLRATRVIAGQITGAGSLVHRLDILGAEIEQRKRHLERYRQAGPEFTALLREHASWHFGVHRDVEALRLLQQARLIIDQLAFRDESERDLAHADVLNRLCVAYKSVGDKPAALEAGGRSLDIAQRYAAHPLIFLNHVDLGYIYYGSVPKCQEISTHWGRAVAHYDHFRDEIARDTVDMTACAHLIRASLLLLESKLDEAGEIIDLNATQCMRKFDTFYGISFMMLQLVRGLLAPEPARQLPLLRRLGDRTVDACITYKMDRLYWKALHAQAQIEVLADETDAALLKYSAAAAQLRKATTETSEILHRYFFEDMALAARRARQPEVIVPGNIRHPALAARVAQILELDDDAFAEFQQCYRPCSTFQSGCRNLPCP